MTDLPTLTLVSRDLVERRVLDIVDGLVAELRGGAGGAAATLDASIDRDLGLGSLERVELLLRLERAFGVRLADRVMAEAERPGDLVAALLGAGLVADEAPPATGTDLGAGTPAPASARTLVEALRWHADAHGDRVHLFLRDDEGHERPITYAALWDGAGAVAAGLRERGVGRGERVAIMLRTEEAFFPAFLGTLAAGGVPVPIYPPFRPDRIEEYARRQAGILRNAGARLLVTFGQAEIVGSFLRGRVPDLEDVTTLDRLARPGARPPALDLSSEDPALIQYTSGSTGDPKGVLLTHANLLANIRAIGEALAIRPDDVVVSWLPLYHDMGLIGSWLGALYFGLPLALLSPLAFLSRPVRWLWAFHAHRGTLSPAPNFAYDLCVSKVTDEEIQGLDLSSWRVALNGSEPVSPDTLARFARRYVAHGFRPEAMCPVYGMAECSVGLTAAPAGRLPRVDRVAREIFQGSRVARPAAPAEDAPLQFVSCGRPLPGHDVRVVDADGSPVGERIEGRIEFRGPSATSGYFRNPDATRAIQHDGWLVTGDLGYLAGDELYITGREKDLVIQGGRNVYPQEVEEVAGEVPGIRKGCVAAFGVPDPQLGTERLVVVAETRERDPVEREALRAAVLERVVGAIGIPPHTVVVTGPGAVLKTSSGKIRRGATREAYLRGELMGGRRSVAAQWITLLAADLGGRASRLLDRAAALAFTGYVVVLVLSTVLPLWVALLALPSRGAADRLVRLWSRLVVGLSTCRVRVGGAERLRGLGPAILVANHASYIDPIVLMAALPGSYRFVAKRKLADYPVLGTFIRRAGYLTIERADLSQRLAGADEVIEALRHGETLCVFPEGTFVRAPGLLPFRLGAFRAAVDAGRPVVPIAIAGTRHILPDRTWLFRRGPIEVAVGEPIAPRDEGWPEMVRLRDLAREAIARDCGEPG